MQFGASMFFTDYSMTAAALARALEERGFESLWAPEHSHIPASRSTPWGGGGELPKRYYDVMDPFISLTMAAAATTTLKLGTGVCLVNQRDPIQTAKLVASIDQVSGGRFLFGIGVGWNAEEMEDHGTAFPTRAKLVRERVEAMKAIWTKSKAEYSGEFVNFPEMMAWPKCVQQPHAPVIVGGAFPQAARRAVRCADRRSDTRRPREVGSPGRRCRSTGLRRAPSRRSLSGTPCSPAPRGRCGSVRQRAGAGRPRSDRHATKIA